MLYPYVQPNQPFYIPGKCLLDVLVQKHSAVIITNKSARSTAASIFYWEGCSQP